jgi:hypothetical protein
MCGEPRAEEEVEDEVEGARGRVSKERVRRQEARMMAKELSCMGSLVEMYSTKCVWLPDVALEKTLDREVVELVAVLRRRFTPPRPVLEPSPPSASPSVSLADDGCDVGGESGPLPGPKTQAYGFFVRRVGARVSLLRFTSALLLSSSSSPTRLGSVMAQLSHGRLARFVTKSS